MNKRLQSIGIAGATVLAGVSAGAYDINIGKEDIQLHGFASQGLLYSDTYNYLGKSTSGSLEFTEAGLNVSLSPFNHTRITAQAFTFDLGNVGRYGVFLDYASLEYTFNDYIGLRGGRIRRPSGIYNHVQDVDLARTFVLLPQGVYNARWRDFFTSIDGGEVFGTVPLGPGGSLSYELYSGIMNLSMQGGVARSFESSLPPFPIGQLDSLPASLMSGSQFWWNTPVSGLRAGISAGYVSGFSGVYSVNPPFGPGEITEKADIPFGTLSAEYVWKNWTFQAEYFTYNYVDHDTVGGFPAGSGRSRPDSWYFLASYRFNKYFELGAYYNEYYRNEAGPDSGPDSAQRDTALAARFDLTDWWIFKLEGHYLRGTALLQDSSRNPAPHSDKPWFMLAAKTTFYF